MKKAPDRYKNSRERIGNVRQRMNNIRGNDTNGSSGGMPHGGTGSVGSSVSTSSHHRGDGTARRVGEVTSDKIRDGVDASQVERRRHEINQRFN